MAKADLPDDIVEIVKNLDTEPWTPNAIAGTALGEDVPGITVQVAGGSIALVINDNRTITRRTWTPAAAPTPSLFS